jgi:hypothetical protein
VANYILRQAQNDTIYLIFLYNMTVGDLLQNPKHKEKFVMQKLLCLFLNCTREQLWTDTERQLGDDLTQKILAAYDDYVVKKKPLEYVL